jgi:16S rRNA (adenine1518-N6/adenine1519-N6)-dimethyltransferase
MEITQLKNLLTSLHLKPKDYLGQNFLINDEVLKELLDNAEIKKTDVVVEIGPGLGTLTKELAAKAGKVIAIEKDKKFVKLLRKYFRREKNVEIVEQDILRFNFENIDGEYKIVANIPYYLTSHLLQMLMTLKNKPKRMVLMMQKEVGERVTAKPGSLSVLGISVQIFADAKVVSFVPKENFWPKPEVDSCIVVIEPKNKYPEIAHQTLFFRILKIAFAGKRKQIHNSLANGLGLGKEQIFELLKDAGIDPSVRPQDVRIEQWIELYKRIEDSV